MFGKAIAIFIMLICLSGCGGGGSSDGPPKVLGLTSRASGTTADLNSVAVGNGKYVAVGDGTILVSSDSVSWTTTNLTTNNFILKTIVYGNNQFVAVGYTKDVYPNKVLLTSQDGINWEQRLPPQRGELLGIVFDGLKFIVVGDRSRLLTSADGITWAETFITQSELVRMKSIAYGGGHYVAVGTSGQARIYRSTDGINWEYVPASGTGEFTCIAYGSGYFVAVKNNATRIYYSTDCATWSVVSYTEWTGKGVTFTGSEFILVGASAGYGDTNLYRFMPSLDLKGEVAISASASFNGILYSDNHIVLVGPGGLIASN